VEGLTAGYSRVPVVKDVSLDLALGEVVLVMGPNGAGKSTLVKAITGQLPLISGRVSIEDTDVSKMREEDRVARGIGYVPQRRDVFGPLSVLENLQMGAFRVPAKEVSGRIAEVLELFPALPALTKRHAKTLSGGERKMVAIARALVADPRLLILDEPTSNLAPQIATTVLTGVVRRVAEAGRAVLLIEQRVSLALEIASWGYLLTDGQVRLQGSAEHFRSRDDLGSLFLGRGGMGMSHADEHPHDGAVRT
jgi:branched-chain amino acid transport system ATP-binding protein